MSVTRIFDLLEHQAGKFPKEDVLANKEKDQWIKYSTSAYINNANHISSGLIALGINKDDKIATISNNRPEWNFVDMGMLQIGAIHVPIYPTISESDYKFILNDAEVKAVFLSDQQLYQKINKIASEIPSLKHIYTFDKVEGAKNWQEIRELGIQNKAQNLEEIKSSIKENDLATIIYTSGTTGNPKGVMLSHNNIVSNFLACHDLAPVDSRHKALSFLPLCHVYERMLTYMYQYIGLSIYYAESLEKIADNIKEVKPDIFTTVPRLLEKVYDKIVAKGKELKGIKRKLFFWALDLGLKYEIGSANGWWYEFQLMLANKLIFNKWREALGGNVKAIVSGGAALQPRLARVFWAAKIPVLEGYGLTETSPVIAVNNFKANGLRFGTVGSSIRNIEIKIAEDGEILCKGPNVMLGYYKRPDLTSEVIDNNGWFHTGDIGVMEEGRFLKITDRKKEIFKTSGGKYVAPQALENKFKESLFIEQIMVIGENQKYPAALIVPTFAHLKEWCSKNNIPYNSNEDIVKNNTIINKIKDEIDHYNKNFGKTEQIKTFELLSKEWTVDSGELTPTMKLKRKIIAEKYKDYINKIYSIE